ncbi:(2Fe-2S)-binding protein [Streptomyces albus]
MCRCEGTDYGALCAAVTDRAGSAARVTKLTTRAGLGPCQGRVCGPTVAELTARLAGAPPDGEPHEGLPPAGPHRRPVAQPIRLGELAAPSAPTDERESSHE